jgi:uncharacterized RDD family membrane protein YckC
MPRTPPNRDVDLQGAYAGAVTRLLAYVIDATVISGLFALALAGISYVVKLFTGKSIAYDHHELLWSLALAGWGFLYFAGSWAASGRTFGMAVLGLQVVRANGTELDPRHAVIRTLAFPLSFLAFGLGFLGILVQRERRALHDLIAGTAVVYAWDARAAHLRFLARQQPVS